jgi:hypothetical protein
MSNIDSPEGQPGDNAEQPLRFYYVKSPQFRVIHAEGVIGGVTPRGYIHFALFSERPALPQVVVQTLDDNGRLGQEVSREGKEGIVREMEVDIMADLKAAVSIRDWLTDRIVELSKLQEERGTPLQ